HVLQKGESSRLLMFFSETELTKSANASRLMQQYFPLGPHARQKGFSEASRFPKLMLLLLLFASRETSRFEVVVWQDPL
ncbi:hypothetical protein PMAYCL1PPCAC_14635, partial [Pristionchus mayeri]